MSKQGQKGRVSLDRALSKLGMSSRTEAKALIEGGRVRVHGSIEKNPARMVNPDTAHIEIDGKKAERSGTRLIIFHKPKGVLTTKRDPEGRKTIYDVLPSSFAGFIRSEDWISTPQGCFCSPTIPDFRVISPIQRIGFCGSTLLAFRGK